MRKVFYFSLLLLVSLFAISGYLSKQDESAEIKVAICPTYHYLEDSLLESNYRVIKTNSSSENFELLENRSTDLILTGRTAKPSEVITNLDFMVVEEEGYSFLSREPKIIQHSQMADLYFVTDLDEERLKKIFPIKNIEKVEDIYNHTNDKILITSWENTDFSKAEITHVLKDNGQRDPLSRRLSIYYLKSNKSLATDLFNTIKPNKDNLKH